jgi:hypothetical protein
MHIEIKVGKETLVLRGQDRQFEICKRRKTVRKLSGKHEEWCPESFHSTMELAIKHLLKMKIARSDASTLHELQYEIKKAKEELAGLYG